MANNLGEITEIFIYPIKSLPGVRVEKARVSKFGLIDVNNQRVGDRYNNTLYYIYIYINRTITKLHFRYLSI